MLGEDANRFQQDADALNHVTDKLTNGMPGKSEADNNMGVKSKETSKGSLSNLEHHVGLANGHVTKPFKTPTDGWASWWTSKDQDDEDRNWRKNKKAVQMKGLTITRAGSVKDLVQKFSVSESNNQTFNSSPIQSPTAVTVKTKASGHLEFTGGMGSKETKSPEKVENQDEPALPEEESLVPLIRVTPMANGKASSCSQNSSLSTTLSTESQSDDDTNPEKGKLSSETADHVKKDKQESDFDASKQPESPPSEAEELRPKVKQNPKYQLYLGTERVGNETRETNGQAGETGTLKSRWEAGDLGSKLSTNYRGSMESLTSRDGDSMSERLNGIESPPRVFNSPYASLSLDPNPNSRISEYKPQEVMSPTLSEYNMFSLSSRSTSPVPPLGRTHISTYETLTRRRGITPTAHMSLRSGLPNKRDFIEELTKQLEESQRRNQFLEAERIALDQERNQIRFEMRGLLVNNEDLLRTNTQLQGEVKRLRDRMVEVESNHNVMVEHLKKMECELKEAREVMVEANTQEYAFNFLQQSLKNKIQDAEDALEKQTQHAKELSEKLWLAERQLEELELEKNSKGKKASELNSNVQRLEVELAEALQLANQNSAELNLQQKLRADAQLRVEELEEAILEKDQELQKMQQIVDKLQGEVSGKLIDKEHILEEEIQLRERIQLQCKQAERMVEDLQMELQSATQAKDDLIKQIKQAQEKVIDLESELEDMKDNEERWISKHKRATEQTEQLQLKLIQEKDLNDQLECDKVILERQVRDLRSEIDDLRTSRVQDDVINKAELKARELENALRVEERNKVTLANTISKLERKVSELADQLEEEKRLSNEQKDLMTQRMRSLKRQLNEAEEEVSRREAQHRHAQRELTEERETNARLQRQLLDCQLQANRRMESMKMRQTLDSLRLDLSVDEEDEPKASEAVPENA